MKKHQELFQREIYKVPTEIERFIKQEKIGKKVNLSAFNSLTRCTNYFMVREDDHFNGWEFSDEKDKIELFLKKHDKEFEKFLNNFDEVTKKKDKDLHYWLIGLYNNYPINPNLYSDGIMKRYVKEFLERNQMMKYAFVDLLFKYKKSLRYKYFPWLKVLFCNESNTERYSVGVIADQEKEDRDKKFGNWFDIKHKEFDDTIKHCNENAIGISLSKHFFFEYLQPLFMGYEDENGIFNGNDFFPLLKQKIEIFEKFILFPIYDAFIDNKICGVFCGNLMIFPFTEPSEEDPYDARQDFISENYSKFVILSQKIAQALYESRSQDILRAPTNFKDDFLQDILRKIVFVQDWNKVMVFSKSRKMPDLHYCFIRYPGGKKGNLAKYYKSWGTCENTNTVNCDFCKLNSIKDFLNDEHHEGEIFQRNNKNPIYCLELDQILNDKVIPSVDSHDRLTYSNHILCFEFSDYTLYPDSVHQKSKIALKQLGDYYTNKLIPIFDKVLLKRKLLQHSTKAAVSAIVSRNHSHHIGSHVTPRTTIEKIEAKLIKIYPSIENEEKKKKDIIKYLKNRLDYYIQKKADFMAEISTEPVQTTATKYLFGDVLSNFIQNILLIDNIAANEGIRYVEKDGRFESRLKIHFMIDDMEILIPYMERSSQCSNLNLAYLKEDLAPQSLIWQDVRPRIAPKDISIAWPGPLGEFALYSFLENFIRNAAKHNYDDVLRYTNENKDLKDLNIFINIKEADGDNRSHFYKIQIWDDISNPLKKKPFGVEEKKLWEWLNIAVKKSIINDEGELIKSAWGISEMKIMATLLRGSSNFFWMGENLTIHPNKKDGEDRLIFEFNLMKPKEVAIISPIAKKIDKNLRENYERGGVWWFETADAFKHATSTSSSIATFDIAVLDKELLCNLKHFEHLLPYRILTTANQGDFTGAVISKDIINYLKKENDPNMVITKVWKTWTEGLLNEKGKGEKVEIYLTIFLGEEEDEGKTKDLFNQVSQWNNQGNDFKLAVIYKDKETLKNNKINPGTAIGKAHFIYDRHSDGSPLLKNSRFLFFEAIDKNSSDFNPIYFSDVSEITICQLMESAFLKILIIDERVAETAFEEISTSQGNKPLNIFPSKERLVLAKGANIFIATHLLINPGKREKIRVKEIHHELIDKTPILCVKVEENEGERGIKSFKTYWCEEPECDNCSMEELKPNALILHQGVTESLLKGTIERKYDGPDFKSKLGKFIQDIREHIPYVMIDSGRGIPANLPETVKFVPFSLIQEYLMRDMIAKHCLTKMLMSIIRRGNV